MGKLVLSQESVALVHKYTKQGGVSTTAMVSIIGTYGYERGKKFGSQLKTLVHKEYDRAKKRIVEDKIEFIKAHGCKCGVCGCELKAKSKTKLIIDGDGLFCQSCYGTLDLLDWQADKAEQVAKYLSLLSCE